MTLVILILVWAAGLWLAHGAWSLGLLGCHTPFAYLGAATGGLILFTSVLAVRRPTLRVPSALILLLLLGMLRYHLHPFTPCLTPGDLAFYNGTPTEPTWATITGTIVRPPEDRDTWVRIRLHAQSLTLQTEEITQPVTGDALFNTDRFPELQYGDRIKVQGRLEAPPVFKGFDYRAYLARQGIHTLIQRPKVSITTHGQGHPFWQILYNIRTNAQTAIGQLIPEPEAALLSGILLGVETGIDRELYDQFNLTGVSHIIVISGSNITIIAGVMTALFGRLLGKRRAFYPVIAGIVLYTLLVGADSSVTRAAIMGGLYAWATYLGRQSTAFVSLFVAGFVMTLINPLALWDVGFQLSFMATLSLMLFTPGMTAWFEGSFDRLFFGIERRFARRGVAASPCRRIAPSPLPRAPESHPLRVALLGFLSDALIVTLAAQILTLPLVAYYFGRVSLVSPLANLLVLPVQPPIMIWGGLAVIVGLISDLLTSDPLTSVSLILWPLARFLILIPWLALHWTVLVVKALAPLPMAALNVDLSPAILLGFYGLVAAAALSTTPSLPLLGSRLQRVRQGLASSTSTTMAAALLFAICFLFIASSRSLPDGRLHVHFLDVERGEAILIETPDGQQVLIDGGYSPTKLLSALGEHMPFHDRQIELVVLTHPGDERIGGLVGLPERYRIKQVLQTPFPYPSTNYENWLRTLQEQHVPVAHAEAGVRIHLGHGATLDVLHPGQEPAFKKDGGVDLKPNSLVLRLSYGVTSFLLTGDVSKEVQEWLVESGQRIESTVVKLPDDGRQAAFCEEFLMATGPQHAVVFTQRQDRFRDLSAVVEEAWVALVGPENYHRTDLAGTVSFASDGQVLTQLLK
ncbi:MAG: ComEC/Rec2 family competence protein [Chloroflexota bacterium]|nr:ComEC/Rec2 family competence protein [Chloroflexota bacterium]